MWKCHTGSGRVNWLYLLNFRREIWTEDPIWGLFTTIGLGYTTKGVSGCKNRGHGGESLGTSVLKILEEEQPAVEEKEPLSQRKPR